MNEDKWYARDLKKEKRQFADMAAFAHPLR